MSTDDDAYARGVTDALGIVETLAATSPATLVLVTRANTVGMDQLAEAIAALDAQRLCTLRPFDLADAATLKQAAGIAGRSESCVRSWCERWRIGRKVGGSLRVSRAALAMVLDGDPPALAAYLCGDRSGPLVAPYFARVGLRVA